MDPKAFLAGGSGARRHHLAEVEAKTAPTTKPAGRRKAHKHDADHISCLIDPEIGHRLRLMQLSIRVELGLLVSEALRLAFAMPEAEERLRKALGKLPKKSEAL